MIAGFAVERHITYRSLISSLFWPPKSHKSETPYVLIGVGRPVKTTTMTEEAKTSCTKADDTWPWRGEERRSRSAGWMGSASDGDGWSVEQVGFDRVWSGWLLKLRRWTDAEWEEVNKVSLGKFVRRTGVIDTLMCTRGVHCMVLGGCWAVPASATVTAGCVVVGMSVSSRLDHPRR